MNVVVPWRSVRVLVGVAVLAVVVWWTGGGPFLRGLRSLDLQTLVLGTAIAVPTTVACAWRWHLVATGLGVGVGLGRAIAACYRAQFLNVTLPGGVLGDVHRGVRHGVSSGAVGRGVRSVVWERVAGQVVQGVIVLAVLLVLPSPFPAWVPALLATAAATIATVAALLSARGGAGPARTGQLVHTLGQDLRQALLPARAWPGVALASTIAVAGHVTTYLVAARAVGVTAPLVGLVPLALVVLLAAGLPLNIAGWGPREGMAAWAFGAAGLGAEQGVAAAVAYGAVVLVASAPGAVLVLTSIQRSPAVEEVVSHG